jgi:FkbM family methyltransferase
MKIIQIGANSGNDNTNKFIVENIENIELVILVEPIPFILDELSNNYKNVPNCIIEPIAIAANEDELILKLYYEDNSNYEVSSFRKKHILDHGCADEKIKSIDVKSMTVNKLMEKYNLTELDYLFIDTEGMDVWIISSLDFNKYKFKNIIFETAHTDGARNKGYNYNEIVNYLESIGYDVTNIDSMNAIATLNW